MIQTTTKTVAASTLRYIAQRKMLEKIRRKFANRMEAEMKKILRASKEAMKIEMEMKKEFAEAIGDREHPLIKDAGFEPLFFTPGFKETKFLAERILQSTTTTTTTNALLNNNNNEKKKKDGLF